MKIICIGMNYREHIAELNSVTPTEPVFFLKPDTALLRNNEDFYVPDFSQDLHYECEVVVKINRLGKSIDRKFAHRYYDEIGLGIDFTARDIQKRCKEQGLPWEIAKAFDKSAALSPQFVSLESLGGDIQNLDFSLCIDGQTRQSANTSQMIYSVDEIIAYVSRFMTLKIGDLIYTGTPVGVGAVSIGNHLEATLNGQKFLDFHIK